MASVTLPISTSTANAAATAESEAPELNYTSIYASSILAMSVLFLAGVGVPMAVFLDDWVAGLGLGAFTAFWGGPSFGVMAGAARVSSWQERYGTDSH